MPSHSHGHLSSAVSFVAAPAETKSKIQPKKKAVKMSASADEAVLEAVALSHMQANTRRNALLAARPLVQLAMNVDCAENAVLAAAVDWMPAATVGDFDARLQ